MYFQIAKFFFKIYYTVFFRMKVYGLENVPKDGAVILCANHLSNYDVITIALALNRLPTYLAKSQLFENKLLGFFLLKLDAIPINRGQADMKAFRAVMDKLKQGGMLGIFAHGHRMKNADAKDAKAGVALFAVKSGAPVVPVAIVSDYNAFGRINVVFGEKLDFSEYKGKKADTEKLSEISTSIMERVEALIEEYS